MAKLNLSLYRIREATQNWIEEYMKRLLELGFTAGPSTPCICWHEEHELFVTLHGDDFAVVGPMESLEWLKCGLEATYEIKTEFLRPKAEKCKEEIRILNRTISWTDQGIHYEPDQRHADLIVEQAGMSNSKPISTPCCTEVENDESKRLQS